MRVNREATYSQESITRSAHEPLYAQVELFLAVCCCRVAFTYQFSVYCNVEVVSQTFTLRFQGHLDTRQKNNNGVILFFL